MHRFRSNKFMLKITIFIAHLLLMLDLNQAAASISDSEMEITEKHKTSAPYAFNLFSIDDAPDSYMRSEYSLKFILDNDVLIEEWRKIHFRENASPTYAEFNKFFDLCQTNTNTSKAKEKISCIVGLTTVLKDIVELDRVKYSIPTYYKIDISDVISRYPMEWLTEQQATAYFFQFIDIVQHYLQTTQNYLKTLKKLQDYKKSRTPKQSIPCIALAKDLLNILLVYHKSINCHLVNTQLKHKDILKRVRFSQIEKTNLIRYCELMISCMPRYKNRSLFKYPGIQARLKKTEKEFSEECMLIKNCNNASLLLMCLSQKWKSLEWIKLFFFDNYNYSIDLDLNGLEEKEGHIIFGFSKLPALTNSIQPVSADASKDLEFISFILFCGTEGTVEIRIPLEYQALPEYKKLEENVKDLLLNKNTKIVPKFDKIAKVEELSDKGYIKAKEEREKTIVKLTKTETANRKFVSFFVFSSGSIFGLFVLSIFDAMASGILSILLPVLIFALALFMLYTLSIKKNKMQKTSYLRGIPLFAIAFFVFYIIISFFLPIVGVDSLTFKTIQILLLVGLSLVVFFGSIASLFIIKNINKPQKHYNSRLMLRIIIYLVSILLLLLPLMMVFINHKGDAMLLIRSDIMTFAAILFFIGVLLEDPNYNESRLQAKRRKNLIVSRVAIAFFAISLILCIGIVYLHSLNKPFDAATEITKESSIFYNFFSELFKSFYSTLAEASSSKV
ncbi:hypothetical protein NEFER03_0507 [Nematocida sp. LUAm3]|nr:hypothetical protein NEFER03_0507 [Nematocida sp. LUAm3]KAI5175474.1 hypothetical protein NEFER02_1380 [Nematocida sp. LUAm2]KAI5178496.1 hypothetical protein NEFER01_1643 [Nematocida sp. LUAm1]